MKLIIRLAKPSTQKEHFLRVETVVDDLNNPGTAWAVIDGKEYLIEVHCEERAVQYGVR